MAEARIATIGLLAVLAGATPVPSSAQDDGFDFMPPGGRDILAALAADAPGKLQEAAARRDDRAGWAEWLREAAPNLDSVQVETFAAYAAFNLPVSDDLVDRIGETGDPGLLPPDGKELAIQQCQFCHGFFSGYLAHDRDEVGWKGTFKAPFHAEIAMSETERNTFASYSALNLPLAIRDVPPELRF